MSATGPNVPCVACGWAPKPGPPQPPDRMMLVPRDEVTDLRALLPEVEDAAVLYEAAADKIVAVRAERDVAVAERDSLQREVERLRPLREILAVAVVELAEPQTGPGEEALWRDRVADFVTVAREALKGEAERPQS